MHWRWGSFITLPKHVSEQKDLRVILDAELKFEEHISVEVKKENAIPALIRRTFSYFDSPLFKKLFTTPHLEYGQVTWTPHLEKYITILENVQRRATKLVDGFNQMRYSEKLKKLNPPSLVYRRFWDILIEIFKHFPTTTILRYLKISDLETVLVENTTTNWYRNYPRWR